MYRYEATSAIKAIVWELELRCSLNKFGTYGASRRGYAREP